MKNWMILGVTIASFTPCFAGTMGAVSEENPFNGFFIGVGGGYNSINITQKSFGKGISNIQTNTGIISNGVAQGNGTPAQYLENTFAPEAQAGYIRKYANTDYLYGLKYTYQYFRTTGTTANLYIPQNGSTTSAAGVTSSLTGYVNATSIQVHANHEMTLLALVGKTFSNNKYVYLGAGPSLFNLKSYNYYSIGYANYDGVTLDVTGLVSYSTPSLWVWGGAAQIGMAYYFSPTWFIDTSYTYAITGNNTSYHQQGFSNASAVGTTSYITSGTLFTRNTLKISNQSLNVSVNKRFDF